MPELFLGLSEDATRQHILDELLFHLKEEERIELECLRARAGIPKKHHHNLDDIMSTIDALVVSGVVKQNMKAVYTILAKAEAQVHGCRLDETHFHEVGEGEAVGNVLGICLALELLAPSRIHASAVQVGRGKVQCAHGLLDIPAPATAAILSQGIPVCNNKREGEWCTPTSAALIKHFVDVFVDLEKE